MLFIQGFHINEIQQQMFRHFWLIIVESKAESFFSMS